MEGDSVASSPEPSAAPVQPVWVFGYGSLMWGEWERAFDCIRAVTADLRGYRRVFNKGSTRNWGTSRAPCPTLNVEAAEGSECRGRAFAFPPERKAAILSYLADREGPGFNLVPLPLSLVGEETTVTAFVPVYSGANIMPAYSAQEIARVVAASTGEKGPCVSYITSTARELLRLGINDPAVNALYAAIVEAPPAQVDNS